MVVKQIRVNKMPAISDDILEIQKIIIECRKNEDNIFQLIQNLDKKDFYHTKQVIKFTDDLESEKENFGKLTMTILKRLDIKNAKAYTRAELKRMKIIE